MCVYNIYIYIFFITFIKFYGFMHLNSYHFNIFISNILLTKIYISNIRLKN